MKYLIAVIAMVLLSGCAARVEHVIVQCDVMKFVNGASGDTTVHAYCRQLSKACPLQIKAPVNTPRMVP
jgi:hypothetical protein